ncbi:stathmin domain-containing protein 1 isoform X1 [Salvelinus sp. IW2-2015]|uniref:stathmin domain-containing protein 1 isoform X1 n=1 Tax=Salvelinus sp. IW2-2015 TaxID=2691554 RepID=UPI000CDFCA44|nr:stathmin domain-containing protein 1 isoform X1 [Salvelinus alpinus]
MGCGSSRFTVVEPVRSSELVGGEEDTVSKQGCRGDSAVSKLTTDSGVVLDTGEVPTLLGAVPRKLSPLAAHIPGLAQESGERPRSSEILEQLLSQGIIAQPRERASGEAYNIMIDDRETPKRRPPPHLESLKGKRDQSVTSQVDMEEKMRQAEEERKEELNVNLRPKSAGVHDPEAASTSREGDIVSPVEVLHAPDAPETPPSPRGIQQDPLDPDPTQTQEGGDGGSGGVREGGGEGVISGLSGQLLSASLEMENDSTFQQTEQAEEQF